MATMAGVSLSTPGVLIKAVDSPRRTQKIQFPSLPHPNNTNWHSQRSSRRIMSMRPIRVAPAEKLSDVVEKSIKEAEETCADDPTTGECAAAWDTVEEASAAASHARDKKKASDPLEDYCKDYPETDECRTYDN